MTQVTVLRSPVRGEPTPEQRDIRPGSYVISEPGGQFAGLVIFGRLWTRADYITVVRDAGTGEPPEPLWLEDDLAWREYRVVLGYMWGTFFSVAEPDGEEGEVHLSTCREITAGEYAAARDRGWR